MMLAGGNQVVQDSVFAIPALQDWLLSANDEVSCMPVLLCTHGRVMPRNTGCCQCLMFQACL